MNRTQKTRIITTLAGISLGALVGLYSTRTAPPTPDVTTQSDSASPTAMSAKRPSSKPSSQPGQEPVGSREDRVVDAGLPQSAPAADDPEVFTSHEKLFIHNALKRPVLDRATKYDPETQRYVRSTLVKDDGEWGYLIVKQSYHDEAMTKVWAETVQVGDHVMVQFQEYLSPARLDAFMREHHLSLKTKMLLKGAYLFVSDVVSIDHMDKLSANLQDKVGIRNAEPNYLLFTTAVPNDPRMGQLWGFDNKGKKTNGQGGYKVGNDIAATEAWDTATDCSSILIGVLDTGIDYNHPDLKDNLSLELGRDFTTRNPKDFMDRNKHGTHCAGSIGAVGNNGIGVAGVCWKAKMVPLKVLGDSGSGSSQGIADAVIYAADSDIKILSMSLGGGGRSSVSEQAYEYLVKKNKLAVIATGNDNKNIDQQPSYPASYPSEAILTVSAYAGGGDLASFSNYGSNGADIAAPGQDIMSTVPNNGYASLSGTSMATPITAGVAALLWAAGPNMKALDVKKELLATADKGDFSKPIAGNRKVNVEKALTVLAPKASLANAEAGGSISLINADTFEFQIKNENPYTAIKSIEIFNGTESLGMAEGDKITAKIPFADGMVKLSAKITDSAGKTFTTPISDMTVDITKSIDLSAIDIGKNKGEVGCKFARVNEKMEETVLFEAKVDTEAYCNKLCGIITPTAFTSKGSLSCVASVPEVDDEKDPTDSDKPEEEKE